MIKITDRVFVETKYVGANVGCVITEQGPVIIDTPMLPEEADDLRAQIGKISDLDISYILYTHQHSDHIIGSTFLPGCVIAHEKAISGLRYLETNLGKDIQLIMPDLYAERSAIFDNRKIVMPQITFDRELGLHLGGKTIKLKFTGGHSSASIIIHVVEDRVVFAGDNLLRDLPTTANGRFGSWIATLHLLEEMDVDAIIPGHGEPSGSGKEDVRNLLTYFETMRDRVGRLAAAGAAREEVLKKVDMTDCLFVPPSDTANKKVAFDIGRMYDQLHQGFV